MTAVQTVVVLPAATVLLGLTSFRLCAGEVTNPGPTRPVEVDTEIPRTPIERLAAVFSPRLRALAADRNQVAKQLLSAARPNRSTTSEALGAHSNISGSANATKWMQVDLGAERTFDTVVIVPAHVSAGDTPSQGYGFPQRFKVEVSATAEFASPVVIADFTAEDFGNPGDFPVVVAAPGQGGRFVRVTATKLWQHGGFAVMALGELMVLAGERNLALGRPVQMSDSRETLPQWAASNLVDGQSVLGLPLAPEPSPSNGYHSFLFEENREAVKWVQVDLGQRTPLDEVRLIPARPRDWALISGFGFPLRFRVEASDEPSFSTALLLRAEDTSDFRNPGENFVVVPCDGIVARFVRVTATRLWLRGDYYVFALAELQAIAGGTNAALGKKVDALDSVESGFWSKQALVDGFSSQQRLVPLTPWLRSLGQSASLESRLHQLNVEHTRLTQSVLRTLGRGTLVALGAAGLALGALFYRYRMVRLLELERLRTRIATDLHDELGTRLTRIGLLSELVERQSGESHPARSHAAQITLMTRDVVQTMDEIVWAVNPRNDTLDDLANYVLHFVEEFFRDSPVRCRFDAPANLPPLHLATEERHNIFLAVKESLNNLLRHADAKNARVSFSVDDCVLTVTVQDDGRGIPEGVARLNGNGLRNIEQRMAAIGGKAIIQSAAGQGTTVCLRVKLKSARGQRK